ncbi:MAG: DUF3352 domain-containing protein, partial [Acidobacteria bacterium]|nr:DUF3352 domain-containing protein [Acidobacteriota bacterium]
MSNLSRKKIILLSIVILLLGVVGWLITRRTQRIVIASYVPQSALGYLETNDWPQLLNRFTSTRAWQQLAPNYGIEEKFNYIGKIGWLASFTGGGEAAMLARSQFAIVLTGLEVRGEEVRPHLALIAETHSSANDLRKTIEKRLPELARRIYGREIKESSEYGGVAVTSYAGGNPERRLFSAQIEGEWILANHPDPLRTCIDTRLDRMPSMADNFYWLNSRPLVQPDSDLIGFISGEGVSRLLRFGAYMLSIGALRETGITDLLQDVLVDLASRTSDGIAYGANFENGQVVDRYGLLFKPDMVDSLKPAIKVNQGEPQSLNFIPSVVKDVTIINVENPNKTLDGIEAAVSARIGVGQSFLLHQFLLGAREVFFGMKSSAIAQPAIGNEIASFNFTREQGDRVWLIAVRDRQGLSRLVERYLSQQSATIRRENYSGVEIINSSNAKNGSAAFIGDFLALGHRAQLLRLIEAHRSGRSFKTSPQFTSAGRLPQKSAVMSFSSVKDESGEMMAALARWLGELPDTQSGHMALDQLPFATSATTLNEKGIYIESHSPFGNFPFFISLVEGVT